MMTAPLQLRSSDFDALIHSPLARAAETARIVWGDRDGPVTELPTLREVDLYAMQVCWCACPPHTLCWSLPFPGPDYIHCSP